MDHTKAQEYKLDLHSDIDKAINELYLKAGENHKVKIKADEIFKNMYDN